MNRRDGGRYNLGKEVVVKTGDGDVIRNPQTLLLEKYPVWKKEGCIPGARAYDRQDGQRLHRQDFCGLQDFPRIYAKERKLRPYEAFAVLVKPQK